MKAVTTRIEKAQSVTPQTTKYRYRTVISDQWIHWKLKKIVPQQHYFCQFSQFSKCPKENCFSCVRCSLITAQTNYYAIPPNTGQLQCNLTKLTTCSSTDSWNWNMRRFPQKFSTSNLKCPKYAVIVLTSWGNSELQHHALERWKIYLQNYLKKWGPALFLEIE